MSSENRYLLTTHQLEIGYKKSKSTISVLSDINISLKPGELVCFMGPNGIGKSTLLRTISGVQAPLRGEILVHKKPVQKLTLNERAKYISVVFTERAAHANLSVYELICLGRYPYTNWSGTLDVEDKAIIEKTIALTGIGPLLDKKLHTLSDGQLQKAMIGRALAQDSGIMILDEPTAHLDLNNRLQVMHLLLEMAHSTQKSILVATHELDLALQTADKLWLASRENSIISGSPEDLVLNGAIEKTFKDESSRFDLFSGRFKMNRLSHSYVALSGPAPAVKWTEHALERAGFKVKENNKTSEFPSIEIKMEAEAYLWKLTKNGIESCYNSIEALVDELC